MTEMTRAQSLEMWKLIAKGILREEGSIDEHGEWCPSPGNQGSYDFIEKVAIEVLKADLDKPNIRGDALIKALGLGGALNEDEHAMRSALKAMDVFHAYDSSGEIIKQNKVQKMKSTIRLYRSLLGYTKENPDIETDNVRKRQLTNFAKKLGINQDKK